MSESNPDPQPPAPEAPPPGEPVAVVKPRPWWARRAFWLTGVLTVLLFVGLAGAWKFDRIEKDPAFCDSCHLASVKASHDSAHKNQRCTDCHENKFNQNVRQWVYGLWSKTKTTPHGKFDKTSCKSCHTSGTSEPWHMSRSLGHAKHVLKAEDPLDCPKCHVWKEHTVEPDPDACSKCHDDIKIFGKHRLEDRKEKIRCVSCHNYLARVGGGAQTPSHDCRRCHGGVDKSQRSQRYAEVIEAKGIPASQIHGNLKACSLCHSPHEEDAEKRRKGAECSRCHVKIPGEFHRTKKPEKFDCNTCHEAHGEREDLRKSCHRCHTEQAKQPKTVAARHDRCSECHKPHEFKATFAGCRDCHKDQTTMLAAWKSETHADCTNCHKPHSLREEDTTCAKCHKKPGHKHKSCTTCHDPHQSKADVKTCASCHGRESHALERGPGKHRAALCLTCHAPHAQQGTSTVCKKCHGKEAQAVTVAKIEKHTRCVNCHSNHAFSTDVSTCRTCHQNPTTGAHTGKCSDCHSVHGPPLGQAASCRNCHKEIAQPAGKHAKCDSCHKNAHGEVKSAPCASCHGPQNSLVKQWKPRSHENCAQCHQTHAPTAPKACASCHKDEGQKVQRTKHRCNTCHETHKPPSQLWSGCAKCHAGEVQAVKGRSGKHSDCKNCHDQHDVTPPKCESCHQARPGAHKAKGHQNCTSCHDTHKRKMPARADCLKCHQNRTNHNPDAQHCYGCHLFNKQ